MVMHQPSMDANKGGHLSVLPFYVTTHSVFTSDKAAHSSLWMQTRRPHGQHKRKIRSLPNHGEKCRSPHQKWVGQIWKGQVGLVYVETHVDSHINSDTNTNLYTHLDKPLDGTFWELQSKNLFFPSVPNTTPSVLSKDNADWCSIHAEDSVVVACHADFPKLAKFIKFDHLILNYPA